MSLPVVEWSQKVSSFPRVSGDEPDGRSGFGRVA